LALARLFVKVPQPGDSLRLKRPKKVTLLRGPGASKVTFLVY